MGGTMIQQTRQAQILDAAEAVLMRYGMKRMTMDDVADAVGMSRPAVYQYYKSKNVLIESVLERFHARILQNVETGLSQEGGLVHQIKLAILARDGLFLEHKLGSSQPVWYLQKGTSGMDRILTGFQFKYQGRIQRHLLQKGVSAEAAKTLPRLIISSAAGLRDMVVSKDQFAKEIEQFLNVILPYEYNYAQSA